MTRCVSVLRRSVRPLLPAGAAGAAERLGDGIAATGVFFDRQDPIALERAIERFEKAEFQFRPEALRAWAEHFSPARFDTHLDHELEACLGGPTA